MMPSRHEARCRWQSYKGERLGLVCLLSDGRLFSPNPVQYKRAPVGSQANKFGERKRRFFFSCAVTYLMDTPKRITESTRTLGRAGKPKEVHCFRLMLTPRGRERLRIGSANPLNQTQLLRIYGIVSALHTRSASHFQLSDICASAYGLFQYLLSISLESIHLLLSKC